MSDIMQSLVRQNLMQREGYSPYCGAAKCSHRWPRTVFDGEQFKCDCGWRSRFEPEFIARYKERWGSPKTMSDQIELAAARAAIRNVVIP